MVREVRVAGVDDREPFVPPLHGRVSEVDALPPLEVHEALPTESPHPALLVVVDPAPTLEPTLFIASSS